MGRSSKAILRLLGGKVLEAVHEGDPLFIRADKNSGSNPLPPFRRGPKVFQRSSAETKNESTHHLVHFLLWGVFVRLRCG